SSDGTMYYTGSLDKTVKSWKLPTDAPLKSLAHPNLVDAVAFNPEGTLLATGCHDGNVRIWDVAKGQVVREIKAHQVSAPQPQAAAVYALTWSSDGKLLLSTSLDKTLKLWDATNGNLVREFKSYKENDKDGNEVEKGHTDGVFCGAFSPDGKTIASGSSDHQLLLWNMADAKVVREFVDPGIKSPIPPGEAHPGWIYGLRFAGDGRYLVSVGNAPFNKGHLAVWSVSDGKLLYTDEQQVGGYYSLAVSPNGKQIVVGTGGNAKTGEERNAAYIFNMPEMVK